MSFECCKNCKPPRRTGDCHCYCTDYAIEKAFNEANRAERFAKHAVECGLASQILAGVDKANKRRKGGK